MIWIPTVLTDADKASLLVLLKKLALAGQVESYPTLIKEIINAIEHHNTHPIVL